MTIQFDELEKILTYWKTFSMTKDKDEITQVELKKRMVAMICDLFNSVHHEDINLKEKVCLDNTYGDIKYKNIISIKTKQKCKL